MKRLALLLIISLLCYNTYAQWGAVLVDKKYTFDSNSNKVVIDTAEHPNIWQIGRPQKIYFDSAYSRPNAIVTDTVGYYPSGNMSSFTIEVKKNKDSIYHTCWGTARLSFWHKYDTDTLFDGGYVEIQYDSSNVWTNVINDPGAWLGEQNFYGLTDTILGNIPAFNGRSNGWVLSDINWLWMAFTKSEGFHYDVKIRFVFQSSTKKVSREGWIIDNIELTIFQCAGGISQLGIANYESVIKINPNPVEQSSVISYQLSESGFVSIKVYDYTGREVITLLNKTEQKGEHINIFDTDKLSSGIYFVRLLNNYQESVAKFVKL